MEWMRRVGVFERVAREAWRSVRWASMLGLCVAIILDLLEWRVVPQAEWRLV